MIESEATPPVRQRDAQSGQEPDQGHAQELRPGEESEAGRALAKREEREVAEVVRGLEKRADPDDDDEPPPRRRRRWVAWVAGATVLVVGAAGALYVARDDGGGSDTDTSTLPTAEVVTTDMVNTTQVDGELGYSASRSIVAESTGRITALPGTGDVIQRGDRVYGVDGHDVPLFYGSTPFWRNLEYGMDDGEDVEVLERNLTELGYGGSFTLNEEFTSATADAVEEWQEDLGVSETGIVKPGDVVIQSNEIRVTKVEATLGGRASGPVLTASGTARRITVDLPVTDQSLAEKGAKVEVTLPGDEKTTGTVDSIGSVATAGDTNSESQTGEGTENATVPVYITLDKKGGAGNLDGAPATVGFTSEEHKDVLAVPINALLASSEGKYEVKVVDADGTVRSVPVELGIFEGEKVEVKGNLKAGMKVQVPES
ncbi:peptidoglycan-binding protein [Streptomyces sp. NPDC004610]|uniref:peptidoglycan-binding protein n=1 Tax=unclassified Streptomyces TaxID=2593676 RepID=UPI0033B8AAED